MRHVPEDELHAYLDQALSRSQCVEIETHMASCGRCRELRDATAALRDRTTALLGQLTPRALIIPPPYESLVHRKGLIPIPPDWRRRVRRAGLWAAGIVAAVGAGWAGRSILDPRQIAPALVSTPPTDLASVASPVSEDLQPNPVADFQPASSPIPLDAPTPKYSAPRPGRFRPAEVVVPAPSLQFVSVSLANREVAVSEPAPLIRTETPAPFDRIWRRVEWEDALQIAGSTVPFIEGMPVIGVLLQPGSPGERPTVIVAQQDASGEVIQSIEGPVEKVNELLARQVTPDVNRSALSRTPPDYVEQFGGGVRRTLRMLTVTGRLSVDSLNALTKLVSIR